MQITQYRHNVIINNKIEAGNAFLDYTDGKYPSLEIYNQKIVKLGIQAPPGTTFILHSDQKVQKIQSIITIGKTGIYQIEGDINIVKIELVVKNRQEYDNLHSIIIDALLEEIS